MVFIYGVHSIGDVAACDPVFLKGLLGVNGLGLWSYANGRDNSRVMHKDFVSPIKSVGHGITCVSDLENEEEVWKVIFALSQDIGHRLRLHNLATRTVQVHVRGNDLFGSQYQCKYRSRHSFPRRSPLPHFGVLKSGILGTRRSERSSSVPLNSHPKAVPSSSRCLIMSSTAWQWRKYRMLWRRFVVALAKVPSLTPASWAI